MTHAPHVYCAETARTHREPLVATASLADLWLLVECPTPWAHDALRDSRLLGDAAKRHLLDLMEAFEGLRVQLIHRASGGGAERSLFVAVPDARDPALYRVPFPDDDALAGLDLAAFARRDPSVEALRTDRLVGLVCTHGRHDPCCARYGAALYRSLRDHPGVDVWQTTHVGGDRFAANLVCLPDGLYFGHLDEAAGRAALDAYAAGRVDAAHYRGRCTHGRFEQAAECLVRLAGAPSGARDLRLRSCAGGGETRVVTFVDAAGASHVATVRRVRDGRRALLTCASTRPEALVTFALDDYRREAP